MGTESHSWCRSVSRDEAIRAAEDAAAAERTPLPEHRDLPQAVAELRERVGRLELEAEEARLELPACCGSLAHAAATLRAERDAALRERDAALARVAELEGAAKPAPAANAGGDSKQEPVAWVATKPGDDGGYQRCLGGDRHKVIHGIDLEASSHPVSVSPLYAAPQPPRGWLTDGERRAVEDGAFVLVHSGYYGAQAKAELLRALLARETPPRVRRPKLQDHLLTQAQRDRDDVWIAAIREAGGEVE